MNAAASLCHFARGFAALAVLWLTTVAALAQATLTTNSYQLGVIINTSGGQLSSDAVDFPVSTAGPLRARYTAGGAHIIAVRPHFYRDGVEVGVGADVTAAQTTDWVNLGPASPGNHLVSVRVEGVGPALLQSWTGVVDIETSPPQGATNFVINIDSTRYFHPNIAPDANTLEVPFTAGTYSLTIVNPEVRPDAVFQEWTPVGPFIATAYGVSVSNRTASASGGDYVGYYATTNRTIEITVPEPVLLRFGVGDGDLANNSGGVSLVAQGITNITAHPQTTQTRIPNGGVIDLRANVLSETITNYQWQLNGVVVPDATNALLHITNAQPAHAGDYRFIVSGGFGSITSSVVTITVEPLANFIWARSVGGTSSDIADAIAHDAQGNVYVTGAFQGTATFGTNSLVSAGNYDAFLAKYDTVGNVLWVKNIATGPDYERGHGITVDADGNVYVCGFFGVSATFDTVTIANHSAGWFDAFLAKYDKDGNQIWVRTGGGARGHDQGLAVAADPTGNVYMAGVFSDTADFGGVTLAGAPTSPDWYGAALVKYDKDGNALWARAGTCVNGNKTGAHSVATDSAGNVYMAGFVRGSADFSGTTITAASAADGFVAKYDSAGNLLWAHGTGIGGDDVDFPAAAVDKMGNLIVVGEFTGSGTLAGSALASAGPSDVLIVKYDTTGNVIWARQAGGPNNDTARGLTVDTNGNIYVFGNFQATARFGGINLTSFSTNSAFLAMYDPNGRAMWAVKAEGANEGVGVTMDTVGNLFVTGNFYDPSTFGTNTLFNEAGAIAASIDASDIFVAKYVALPVISAQPTNQTVIAGITASLIVTVSSPPPISYQWQRSGTNLASATNATLSLTNVQPAQAGDYTVVVSNPAGSVTSAAATLTVLVPPQITLAPPASVTNFVGDTAQFGVTATGTAPLAYQWFKGGSPVAGATGATLTLPNVQPVQAGNYSVVITNAAGAVTSTPPTELTVLATNGVIGPATGIADRFYDDGFVRPDSSGSVGGYTSFFGYAADSQYSNAGQGTLTFHSTNIVGNQMTIVTDVYSLGGVVPPPAPFAGSFFSIPSQPLLNAASMTRTVTVVTLTAPNITTPPQGQSFTFGSSTILSVTAAGYGLISYQWQFNGTNIPGATGATLPLTNLTPTKAGAYTVMVGNAYGTNTSAAANLFFFGDLKFIASVTLAGAIGQQFRVDFADVVNIGTTNWQVLTNVTLPYSPFLVIDPASPGQAHRYYRAVPVP